MSRPNTHHRAVDVFTTAANLTLNDCREIAADHSAKGRLASGATAKRAADAFRQRSEEALDQLLQEVGNQVDHRGPRWRNAMADVERALNEHLLSAPDVLENTFKLAKIDRGSARDAIIAILEWDADSLRKRLAAFRDGWTSPRPKRWVERHPVIYAIALLVLGVVAGKVAEPIAHAIWSNDTNNQQSAPKKAH